MTATIAYDKPVKNFIDELSVTGHVTHRSYKKTSVTLHHNAGRLSHEGMLKVWETRPASAHFNVDGAGTVAQFVKINEYAWAVGNAEGNRTSISIEMANSKLSPSWEVGENTWKNAARLAGWLFYKEIGTRPSKSNLHYHSHWAATICAGPYMAKIYDEVLKAAQSAYDVFKAKDQQPPSPSPTPTPTPEPAPGKKSIKELAAEVIAGKWGNGDERFRRLTEAGYNARAVQNEVNHRLGARSRDSSTKPVSVIAREVIAGKWGNGAERVRRLRRAGYNATTVQAEVNRQLSN